MRTHRSLPLVAAAFTLTAAACSAPASSDASWRASSDELTSAAPHGTFTLSQSFLGAPGRGNYWNPAALVADVDGDGVEDMLYGEPDAPAGHIDETGLEATQGKVTVLSGRTLQRVSTIRNYDPLRSGPFGYAVAGLGDQTADGAEDYAFGLPVFDLVRTAHTIANQSERGRLELWSPNATGTFVVKDVSSPLAGGTPDRGYFGRDLRFLGGPRNILAVAQPYFEGGRIVGIDAKTGAELWISESTSLDESTLNERRAYTIFSIDDVDGDGTPDLAASAQGQDDPNVEGDMPEDQFRGRMYFYSGATGKMLAILEGPMPGARLGSSAASIADINGDGRHEVLVGAGYARGYQGDAYVIDGRIFTDSASRTRVRSIAREPSLALRVHHGGAPYDELGFAAASLWDVDGDGVDDYALGTPTNVTGNSGGYDVLGGGVQIVSGKSGTVLQRLRGPAAAGARMGGTLLVNRTRRSLYAAGLQGDAGYVALYTWTATR